MMFDLQVLAFRTDMTRVSAFKMGRDVSSRVYTESDVKTPFHSLSHHGQAPVEIAGLRIDPTAHRVNGNGQPLALGPTEFRLLHYFMTHPNRVYTRTQLMDEIWGDQVIIEERTVDVHIRRLRQALSPSAHDALIETVRGRGYALRTEPIAVGKA